MCLYKFLGSIWLVRLHLLLNNMNYARNWWNSKPTTAVPVWCCGSIPKRCIVSCDRSSDQWLGSRYDSITTCSASLWCLRIFFLLQKSLLNNVQITVTQWWIFKQDPPNGDYKTDVCCLSTGLGKWPLICDLSVSPWILVSQLGDIFSPNAQAVNGFF